MPPRTPKDFEDELDEGTILIRCLCLHAAATRLSGHMSGKDVVQGTIEMAKAFEREYIMKEGE